MFIPISGCCHVYEWYWFMCNSQGRKLHFTIPSISPTLAGNLPWLLASVLRHNGGLANIRGNAKNIHDTDDNLENFKMFSLFSPQVVYAWFLIFLNPSHCESHNDRIPTKNIYTTEEVWYCFTHLCAHLVP